MNVSMLQRWTLTIFIKKSGQCRKIGHFIVNYLTFYNSALAISFVRRIKFVACFEEMNQKCTVSAVRPEIIQSEIQMEKV